jgi:hypothetical protein
MASANAKWLEEFWVKRWNEGDFESIFEQTPPDYVFDMHGGGPPGMRRTYVGPDGMRELAEGWLREYWEEPLKAVLDRLIELDEDRVLFLFTLVGVGRGSGVRVERPYAHIWTFRDGVPVRTDGYPTWEIGFAAAGLEPDA